ncbi:DUF2779 domain-containing protein [Helicobacter suis]|uniref:DUF2779 domain-containing protein n=1 Tax=Helicobacter suis TaxID=104628 RepID=UPI0031F9DC95
MKNDFLQPVRDFVSQIPKFLACIEQVLENSQEPNIVIGKHCNSPRECLAKPYCWEEQLGIKGHDHIFAITNHGFSSKIMKLYQDKKIFFKDLTPKDIQALTPNQRMQVECALKNTPHIEKDKIKEFLAHLKYPLYHLDFETYQPAIPLFDETKPYTQIPFQYSIHVEFEDGRLEHKEFLAECGTDGRLELAQRLVTDIPKDACVLAYHASFEKGRLTELAHLFQTSHPDLSESLLAICKNIMDLEIPFKNKDYYTCRMHGSSSIKEVLPALVPDFEKAYKDLDLVHNGQEAMEAYEQMPHIQRLSKNNTDKPF